jgi:hypothetical protein
MMLSPTSRWLAFCLAAGLSSMLLAAEGPGQDTLLFATGGAPEEAAPAAPGNAQALLDEVKKRELDRQLASKQTEIDRIKQDQEKAEHDAANVQKTIESTAALIKDSDEEVARLTAESRRLEHELQLAGARIDAERLKVDGLRALSAAQTKSLSAVARRAEEAEARTRLRAAELALLREGKPIPAEGREEAAPGEVAKCRKALAAAEAKTETEEKAAREAMKAAAAKMALAEAKASTAKRLAENDLTLPPITEKTKPRSSDKPAEKRETDAPVRKAPSATAAASTPKPTPRPVAGPARVNTPPRGPFFGR